MNILFTRGGIFNSKICIESRNINLRAFSDSIKDMRNASPNTVLNKGERVLVKENAKLNLAGEYELDLTSDPFKYLRENIPIIVGRDGNIRIPNEYTCVSRKHLQVEKRNDGFIVMDLSSNGTKISNPGNSIVKSVNDSRNPNIQKAVARSRNGGYVNWELIVEDEYARIREVGPYHKEYGINNFQGSKYEVQNLITPTVNLGVELIYQNGWAYRAANSNIFIKHPVERLSMNVKASSDLIKKLDRFMKTGKYTDNYGQVKTLKNKPDFYYKTYKNVEYWGKRQDPITMYFGDKINQETKKAIEIITAPHARGNVYNASANAPWISNATKEPNKSDIHSLIQKLQQHSYELANILRNEGDIISAGQYDAYKNILKEFER